MVERRHELSEVQWQAVESILPTAKGRGRRPRPPRDMLNGIMWILKAGTELLRGLHWVA